MKVKTFCCGGFGLNMAVGIVAALPDSDLVLLDTTEKNMQPSLKDKPFVRVGKESLDGGGKIRSVVAEVAKTESKTWLLSHQPADVNIVVTSLSGGSGSTISVLLLEQLLENKRAAVLVAVWDQTNLQSISNQKKVIESLNYLSKKYGKCLTIFISNKTTAREQDKEVVCVLSSLTVLTEQSTEFDSADFSSAFNPSSNLISGLTPQLLVGTLDETDKKNVILVTEVTCHSNRVVKAAKKMPLYSSFALISETSEKPNEESAPIVFKTYAGLAGIMVKETEDLIAETNNMLMISAVDTTAVPDVDCLDF